MNRFCCYRTVHNLGSCVTTAAGLCHGCPSRCQEIRWNSGNGPLDSSGPSQLVHAVHAGGIVHPSYAPDADADSNQYDADGDPARAGNPAGL